MICEVCGNEIEDLPKWTPEYGQMCATCFEGTGRTIKNNELDLDDPELDETNDKYAEYEMSNDEEDDFWKDFADYEE